MSLLAWMVGVTIFNAIVAGLLMVGVFSLIERNIGVGAFGGIGLAAAVIYLEGTLGERWFSVTVSEMKMLVIAAAIGAAIGVTVTVLTVKPELD